MAEVKKTPAKPQTLSLKIGAPIVPPKAFSVKRGIVGTMQLEVSVVPEAQNSKPFRSEKGIAPEVVV